MTTPRYLMMAARPIIPDGTVGIFALGIINSACYSSLRNKYTFACDSVGSAASSTAYTYGGSAVGDTTKGIFSLGTGCTVRNKYFYASDSNCLATAATSSTSDGSASGNSTIGIITRGGGGGADKYTYSGCTVANIGYCLSSRYGAAAGSNTVGIFALGSAVASPRNKRKKITYSTNAVATATNSSNNSVYASAVGNLTRGIFALGVSNLCTSVPTTARDKYLYACDTSTVTTSSSVGSRYGSAAGKSTLGIFALGSTDLCTNAGGSFTRNKYTYSTDTNSGATNATYRSACGAATSNGVTGVNT